MTAAPRASRLLFGRERIETARAGIVELMHEHWGEVGHYRDLPLEPDFDRYDFLERAGTLRIYTARALDRANTEAVQNRGGLPLVGYALYFVGPGLHYQHTLMAQQSTLFLHASYRDGTDGIRFIFWTEEQLCTEGVELITQHVKAKHDPARAQSFIGLLERHGYELQDYVLTKRVKR